MEAAPQLELPAALDRSRFSELVRDHHRGLIAYATALVRSDAAARDLVQEAFVAAWQSLERFQPGRDFGGWMRGIVRNKWREHCRRHRREVPLAEETLLALEAPFAAAPDDAALFARLAECRAKLPAPMSEALRLTYDEGRSSEDAAGILSTTAAALRKRLERARDALRLCLSRES